MVENIVDMHMKLHIILLLQCFGGKGGGGGEGGVGLNDTL